MLKNLFIPLLLFPVSIFAHAGYLAGGDFSYRSLGGDSFLLKLNIYSDCMDSTAGNSQIKIIPQNCPHAFFFITLPLISIKDVTPVCGSSASQCKGGSLAGMQTFTYSGVLNLSSVSCCSFIISYESASRHYNINSGQSTQDLYLETYLNKCVSPANSSAVFDDLPHMFLAAGQDQHISFSATDTVDHDSLVFSLEEPLQSAGNPAFYGGVYNHLRPMQFLGFPNSGAALPAGFHLNPYTGLLEFRPTKVENAVVAVKVTEFRKINGISTIIGEITRDLVLGVNSNPSNAVPVLHGDIAHKACAGEQYCFKMFATDANSADSTKLFFMNKGISGNATFIRSGGQTDSATFCWTPTVQDVSTLPYHFTVTAKDNHCSFNSYVSKVFSITVLNNFSITAQPSHSVNCRKVTFNHGVISAPANLTYQWSGAGGFNSKDSLPVFYYAAGGKYTYSLTITSPHNCDTFFFSDTLQINVVVADAGPNDSACLGSNPKLLKGIPSGGTWYGAGVSGNFFDPLAAGIGTHLLFYQFQDINGCISLDSMWFFVNSPPGADAGPDREMCVTVGNITLTGYPAGGVWSGLGVSGNDFFPFSGGDWKLAYTFTASTGCQSTDTVIYHISSLPTAGFVASPLSGNVPLLVAFTNKSTIETKIWSWDFGDPGSGGNNFSNKPSPIHTYTTKGSFTVRLKVETGSCSDSIIKINHINTWNVGTNATAGRENLLIYPNPSDGEFTISTGTLNNESLNLKIYDCLGRIVMDVHGIENEYLIRRGTLPAGIYHVRLNGESGIFYAASLITE